MRARRLSATSEKTKGGGENIKLSRFSGWLSHCWLSLPVCCSSCALAGRATFSQAFAPLWCCAVYDGCPCGTSPVTSILSDGIFFTIPNFCAPSETVEKSTEKRQMFFCCTALVLPCIASCTVLYLVFWSSLYMKKPEQGQDAGRRKTEHATGGAKCPISRDFVVNRYNIPQRQEKRRKPPKWTRERHKRPRTGARPQEQETDSHRASNRNSPTTAGEGSRTAHRRRRTAHRRPKQGRGDRQQASRESDSESARKPSTNMAEKVDNLGDWE